MNGAILVVDDSATIRAVVRKAIQAASPDQRIVEAANGGLALKALRREDVGLVITDLHMPEISGFELIDALLADPSTAHIPVFVLTAEPRASRLDELCRRGIVGYLQKPFAPDGLRDALGRLAIGVADAA